jgi:hypothetical protein
MKVIEINLEVGSVMIKDWKSVSELLPPPLHTFFQILRSDGKETVEIFSMTFLQR